MKFIKLYHLNNSTVIEVLPDNYVEWQPKTFDQIDEKLAEFSVVAQRIQKKCVVVIDCDKTVHFDRINFVLLNELLQRSIQFTLIVIMKKCNSVIKTLVQNMKLQKNIRVYFNDIYRI